MKIETLAVHSGNRVDPATGAVTLPIHLTTTFERGEDGGYPEGYIYARNSNPNRAMLEECLAALEGGAAAAAFASGSAASMAVFQSLSPGDHVLAPNDVYHGTARMLNEIFAPWGLETTFLDMTDPAQIERAIRPSTRLLWIETPYNPLLKVTDIQRVAEIARGAGAGCVCDNTGATAGPTASPGAGRGPGGPQHHQIPERPQSTDRRRAHHQPNGHLRRDEVHPEVHRRGAQPV